MMQPPPPNLPHPLSMEVVAVVLEEGEGEEEEVVVVVGLLYHLARVRAAAPWKRCEVSLLGGCSSPPLPPPLSQTWPS